MEKDIIERTWQDKIISGFNESYYNLTEPVLLKLARMRFAAAYREPDSQPLITVYTPTYNRGELFLKRALPSVLAQTYKNFEYIIVGDHCTDNTEELVKGVKDPRIRFYNLPSRGYRYPPTAENHWLAGPVVAANQALKMIKGKWIARLDDDDSWTPDHLEELLKFAQAGNYEFVSAQYIEENYGKKRVVDGEWAQGPYFNKTNKPVKGDNPKINGPLTWFYRSYLKFFKYNINCWRKSWNRVNDIDISIRMFKAGVRMGFLEKPLAYYEPRPGEQTIGLAAYKLSEKDKLKHFEFEK
ncbi:glycosyltransferase family 2 protein [Candidatus Falkowbacteria bacterium]|nr:glycosyltransferase family 2 protein [Candidatus Falkowbacteria bacterium]